MARRHEVTLTKYEEKLFGWARKGHLNAFSDYFFRLPWSGTWYTPEDKPDVYEKLFDVWQIQGRPDEKFKAQVGENIIEYKIAWGGYGDYPQFLYPHGYLFLPWAMHMVESQKLVVIGEGGTGSGKTSALGMLEVTFCAIYPGFDAMNVGPTSRQSQDMLEEVGKWITGTEFERFIVPTRTGEPWKYHPHPTLIIDCGQESYSTFMCQTLGSDIGNITGDAILGTEKDMISVDEASLVTDIEETLARLITRYRGVRRTGMQRYSRPAFAMITNPHPNPSFDEVKKKAREGSADPESPYLFVNPTEYDNLYVTKQQLNLHMDMLTTAQVERWIEGKDSVFETLGAIPLAIIEQCRSQTLEEQLVAIENGEMPGLFERHPDFGITRFELPASEEATYVVFGDPGTMRPMTLNTNNVPVVGAMDITGFPHVPARLWALHFFSGNGRYTPWINLMKRLMLEYHAIGVYDATGMGKAFNEWPDMENYPLYPVTLAGNNKATAKTMFQLFSGKGLFEWPHLKLLWHQAQMYRESGPGLNKLPDDILAGLFVMSFYIRLTFWEELAKMFKWEKEQIEEQSIPANNVPRRSRYGTRRQRYGRKKRPRSAKTPYTVS